MPLYEYRCNKCSHKFSLLVGVTAEKVKKACPTASRTPAAVNSSICGPNTKEIPCANPGRNTDLTARTTRIPNKTGIKIFDHFSIPF